MSKSNLFFGQPLYGQLINLLDKEKNLELSRSKGGERYIKRFDAWTHLVTMYCCYNAPRFHCVKYLCLCWLKHENYRI